jgi:hypothetical protein
MTLEWSIAGALLLLALAPIAKRWSSPMTWAALIAVGAMAVTGMWWGEASLKRKEASKPAVRSKTPHDGRPGGYVTSDSCRSCRPRQHDNHSLELLE